MLLFFLSRQPRYEREPGCWCYFQPPVLAGVFEFGWKHERSFFQRVARRRGGFFRRSIFRSLASFRAKRAVCRKARLRLF
jgi:hypothetical protein